LLVVFNCHGVWICLMRPQVLVVNLLATSR
jgi:hypothetical protein